MEIKYEIDDGKVKDFTEGAKLSLKSHSSKYTDEIIHEAIRIEENLRENGAVKEITDNIVFQSVRSLKTNPVKKKRWHSILLKISSEFLLFFAGLLFNTDKFAKKPLQMYLFIFILIVAVGLTVALHFKEN